MENLPAVPDGDEFELDLFDVVSPPTPNGVGEATLPDPTDPPQLMDIPSDAPLPIKDEPSEPVITSQPRSELEPPIIT